MLILRCLLFIALNVAYVFILIPYIWCSQAYARCNISVIQVTFIHAYPCLYFTKYNFYGKITQLEPLELAQERGIRHGSEAPIGIWHALNHRVGARALPIARRTARKSAPPLARCRPPEAAQVVRFALERKETSPARARYLRPSVEQGAGARWLAETPLQPVGAFLLLQTNRPPMLS